MNKEERRLWITFILGIIIGCFILISTMFVTGYAPRQIQEKLDILKENYCWLALHTYENFLDNETDYTFGDVFKYINFLELREACKMDGYHPNKFTEIREVNERGAD